MKTYLLTVCYPPDGVPPGPSELQAIMREVAAVRAEMKAAGAWVFAAGMHPPDTATTLKPVDGEVLTIDGPFAEGKEYIGGFSIIRAADLDAALEWGRKMARAVTVPVEVRPLRVD